MPRLVHAALALLTTIAPDAFAYCGGGLTGRSNAGNIYIGQGDCEFSEEMIIVSKGKFSKKLYNFSEACKYSDGNRVFSCSSKGKSPLAGAKYIIKYDPKKKDYCGDSPLSYYACVKGCTENSPARFSIETFECDG